MKSLFILVVALLLISGCSDQKKESEKKDHVLREQIDIVHDAKAVTQSMNTKIVESKYQTKHVDDEYCKDCR